MNACRMNARRMIACRMNAATLLSALMLALPASAQHAPAAMTPIHNDPRVIETTIAADTSAPLRIMAAGTQALPPSRARTIVPLRLIGPRERSALPASTQPRAALPLSALVTGVGNVAAPHVNTGGTSVNIDGIDVTNVAPSDVNGSVGESQYVQAANIRMAIYDKNDGTLLLGPFPTNALFTGFAGSAGATACRLSNTSGAIVTYDKLANRWVITQIASAPGGGLSGPFYICIAVSTSPDATGSYYRYVLDMRDGGGAPVYNDFPQMSVWPDAYYATFVLFDSPLGGYRGPRACGFDRIAMLAGENVVIRCADFGTAYGPLLASDLDGTRLPPLGTPNFLMSLDYDASGAGDHLFLWRFAFSASFISGPITVPVAPFVIGCPSTYGGPCIAQPAPGELLDAVSDRLMPRLAYRNFGDREALVVNHTVQQSDAATDGPVAVRWYEIREPNGNVAVYQQGNYAPDSNSRWVGSLAMDKMGNIALGYSVSGPTTPPGVRYTGRLRSEPRGRMEAEATIVDGTGVQIGTFNRWGDFSAMAIDPIGDCAFWSTQQYIAQTGYFNWRTRIARFQFNNCTP